jgi:hypothetical protein
MDNLEKVAAVGSGESLAEVRERFKGWRETRGRGEHIPSIVVGGGGWQSHENTACTSPRGNSS